MPIQGLPIDRLVSIDVNLTPLGAPLNNFRVLLIVGDSSVLHTDIQEYSGIDEVAAEFGPTTPEYQASLVYFEQVPRPNTLSIARWAKTPTSGALIGGILTPQEQLITNWTAITGGSFNVSFNGGAPTAVTAVDFSAETNLNGVASKIQAKLGAGNTCVWDAFNEQFMITSGTTGPTSSVSFASAPTGAGVDISAMLRMTSALAEQSVTGHALETPRDAVARLDGYNWYGLTFATSVPLTSLEHIDVAEYIEASDNRHIYGVSTQDTAVMDQNIDTDVGSLLQSLGLRKTFVHYSSSNAYAAASFFGRAFTVDFNASQSTITMMYKQMPGITGETLTTTQANTLETKHVNCYVNYRNNTSIIEYGVMSGPYYFDEIYGLDGLADGIQDDLFNILYQSPKVPQTDTGVSLLATGCAHTLSRFARNGLIAPGVWNAQGFGTMEYGQFLPLGWYIYAESVDLQDQATREQRISPVIQIACKLAGAIHIVPVILNVNR